MLKRNVFFGIAILMVNLALEKNLFSVSRSDGWSDAGYLSTCVKPKSKPKKYLSRDVAADNAVLSQNVSNTLNRAKRGNHEKAESRFRLQKNDISDDFSDNTSLNGQANIESFSLSSTTVSDGNNQKRRVYAKAKQMKKRGKKVSTKTTEHGKLQKAKRKRKTWRVEQEDAFRIKRGSGKNKPKIIQNQGYQTGSYSLADKAFVQNDY